MPTTTATPLFSSFSPPDDEEVFPPPLVLPPAPPEKTLELSELVEVLPPPSIAPPAPPPAKALELKELVEVLPSPTASSPLSDHVEHVVVVEEPPPPPLPSVTSPSLKFVEPMYVAPPIPTGIPPQPSTSLSSDTVPVSVPPPPPMVSIMLLCCVNNTTSCIFRIQIINLQVDWLASHLLISFFLLKFYSVAVAVAAEQQTAQMLEQNEPGGGLSSELPTILESTISVASNLSNDSYDEDSIPPLIVKNNSNRGIGDLLESIRGGTKQLKKVEPDTQQVIIRDSR